MGVQFIPTNKDDDVEVVEIRSKETIDTSSSTNANGEEHGGLQSQSQSQSPQPQHERLLRNDANDPTNETRKKKPPQNNNSNPRQFFRDTLSNGLSDRHLGLGRQHSARGQLSFSSSTSRPRSLFQQSSIQQSRSLFRRTMTSDINCDGGENGGGMEYPDYWMPPPNENFATNNATNANTNNAAGNNAATAGNHHPIQQQQQPPLQVDFRCACFKLTDVSTVNFTTVVKFVVVFEWNDPRLKGMSMTTNDLPVDLWGPDIILENAQNDCAVLYDSFSLIDAKKGRLKRTVTFHGPVYNPMNLKDFPFDKDDLELKFISICNWRTLDESRHGNDPCNQVYILKPMVDKKHVPFFLLGWGGKINEFHMLGWTVDVDNPEGDPTRPIIVKFDIHLVRKWHYYMWKVMFPLWLIILTSLAPYGIEADEFQGRLEVIFTLLLSTVALLYVVQESIPKVSFLTTVDKVVISTLLALSLSVLFSYLVLKSAHPETLNFILAIANQAAYWLANIVLIVPPYLRYKRHIAKVVANQESKETTKRSKDPEVEVPSNRPHHLSSSFGYQGKSSHSFAAKWMDELDNDSFFDDSSDGENRR